jgi:acetyl-CoA/propionyl-CoA carboxylase biotin carboxyl carrier protein
MDITGVATVLPFHRAVVQAPDFTSETALGIHTRWIETDFAGQIPADDEFGTAVPDGERRTITVDVDGRRLAVGLPAALLDGWARFGGAVPAGVSLDGAPLSGPAEGGGSGGGAADPGELRAGMSGTVVKWLVEPGDDVAAGDAVVVLEAMKMETQVAAHRGGTVTDVRAQAGGVVMAGAVLALIG